MDHFLLTSISFFGLLTIASYASVLAQKMRFPYSIFLFLIGILIVILGKYFPYFALVSQIELSKELVFYIFLPTLIFESAYNIPYKKLLRDIVPISGLAILSLFISTFIIGILFKFILGFLGFQIPYLVSFLFGAIISATDPVAVMAIFKEYGVPKRITYLFEGESLFNDGTAVALFFILLGIIQSGSQITSDAVLQGVLSFFSMIIGGALFGLIMGWIFSKLIGNVRHSWAELTLTLLLAHTTFIFADLISAQFEVLKISAIIATTLAALTIGNYGRYKISRDVRKMMDSTWGYLAFISNSLIFLLMGMLIGKIDFHLQTLVIPIVIALIVVVIARGISVIAVLTPLNKILNYPIDWNWQKLIAWGSLRGVIAITMLLFIPADLNLENWGLSISIREFLSVIVISCIIFTLVIKATTMQKIIKKMGLADLTSEEEFTLHQIKELIDKSILKKLLTFSGKKYVPEEVLKILIQKYKLADKLENDEMKKHALPKKEFKNLLRKYALGIERHTIVEVFESKEIDEYALKVTLNKIENQYMRLEAGLQQLRDPSEKEHFYYNASQKIRQFFRFKSSNIAMLKEKYAFYRSRSLITERVIDQLEEFQCNFYSDLEYNECFEELIKQYEVWNATANKKMYKIEDQKKGLIHTQESTLLNNHLVYLEEELLDRLYSKHIMNGKIHNMLKKSLWK